MKTNRIALTAISVVALAAAANAQPTNSFDWRFGTIANPASPTTEVNPSDGVATATIDGDLNNYYLGMGPFGLYGTQSGLWDIQNGLLELAIDDRIGVPQENYLVDYTVVLRQFVDGGGFFPGTVTFSIPGVQSVGRTIVEQRTGSMLGYWVEDTYHWSQVTLAGPDSFSMTIAPAESGNGHLLVDAVQLQIVGTLDKIPEPAGLQLLLVGFGALGLRGWLRRKAAA